MKKPIQFFFPVLAIFFMAGSSCEKTTRSLTPQQEACLLECDNSRKRIVHEYDNCVDIARGAHEGEMDRCHAGPIEGKAACIQSARQMLNNATNQCKETRDAAWREFFGCDGKCFMLDPTPTQ